METVGTVKRTAYRFSIADFAVEVVFEGDDSVNSLRLLPSLQPFLTGALAEPLLFSLMVDDSLRPVPRAGRERIRAFDTGNGTTVVDRIASTGGYQYIVKDSEGADCCLLQTNADFSVCRCALRGHYVMRSFGLNNALMMVFAYAASRRQCLLIHASLVRQDGYGYAFVAKSGTGKSTQVSMWLRHLPGCDLMNDDNPIVRITDGRPYIYGSPWSGKTPCYRNVKAPLGAVSSIVRAPENSVERLSAVAAFATFLPACSSMVWDVETYRLTCDTVARVVETTGIYALHCLPNKESAIVCNTAIKVRTPRP